jgi:hypothetical protein
MYKTSLTFFFKLGHDIPSVMWMTERSSPEQRADFLARSIAALEAFTGAETITELLPRSQEAGGVLLEELRLWQRGEQLAANLPLLRQRVQVFSIMLTEEVDQTHVYTLTDKGNLSIDKLVKGASSGYPPEVLAMIDSWIRKEIDEAGKCLACALYTSSGFHILRSVEIAIKGYVHAAKGSLPPVNRRNWGEYIDLLTNNGASASLIDLLRILKTKRNPLMHPQDRLEEDEAIDLLCICQAVTGALVKEVKSRSLEAQFASSLAILPTL